MWRATRRELPSASKKNIKNYFILNKVLSGWSITRLCISLETERKWAESWAERCEAAFWDFASYQWLITNKTLISGNWVESNKATSPASTPTRSLSSPGVSCDNVVARRLQNRDVSRCSCRDHCQLLFRPRSEGSRRPCISHVMDISASGIYFGRQLRRNLWTLANQTPMNNIFEISVKTT